MSKIIDDPKLCVCGGKGCHRCSAQHLPPTAADLRRWYTGPWCSECGSWIADCDCKLTLVHRPGLWERMPSAKPEGLLVDPWRLKEPCGDQHVIYKYLPDHVAASLCVMGVVNSEAVPWDGEGLKFWASVYEIIHERSCSLPEAVAIACHRWLDSKETP